LYTFSIFHSEGLEGSDEAKKTNEDKCNVMEKEKEKEEWFI